MKAPIPSRQRADADYATEDAQWQAVVAKDPKADGQFYFAVKTTGVYCLPSCPARPALRQNVRFFADPEAAEEAGFRACKRCSPKGPKLAEAHRKAVARACRAIESAEEEPKLDALAKIAAMSPYHFHRVFKATTGVTPKEYATADRSRRMRDALSKNGTVTEAIYEAGFRSNGRFYASSTETLGMTPTKFRNGGAGTTIRFAIAECSLGSALIAASEKGVCAITLGDDPEALLKDLQRRFPKADLIGADADFERLVSRVVAHIEAPQTDLGLPLDIRGTAFQQKVWQVLREIPVGTTASYADIAKRVGSPKSVRAVAGACAANAIAVAIPCHRVVRNDGGISGYRWGVARKRSLLKREATT